MKKRLTFITFLMLFCSTVFGQSHWGTPGKYENNMSLLGIVHINGVEQKSGDLEIAAFCGDQLRGVTVPFEVDLGNETIFPFMLTIGSNTQHEIIEFKVYDPNAENGEGKEYGSDYKVTFKKDETIGSEQSLEVINFVPKYWNENEVVNYGNTMVIGAIITIDGVSQDHRADLEVAAFCGNELRGVTRPYFEVSTNTYMIDLLVQGEGDVNKIETIHFELYDHSGNIDVELLPLQSDYTVDFVDNGTIGIINLNFVYQSVAKVGETYYTTLAAAVDAATVENNTVTLLRDVEGSGVVINKNVTIDFGGFTYTFNEGVGNIPSNGFQILKDNTVTLMNGKLQVAESAKDKFYTIIQNYANLTVEDMTLDGTNLDKWSTTDGDSYTLSNNSGHVDIKSSTIIANDEGAKAFAFDACKYQSYETPVVTLWDNDNLVFGRVELTGGSIIGNTADGLEVVAKKEFKAVSGVQGATAGWGTISTPVYTDGNNGVAIPAGNHDLYKYDEAAASWRFYTGENAGTPFTTFDLGIGYLYANTEDITIELQGKLANGKEVSFPLSYTQAADPLAGFNFIGNPYACNINLDNLEIENYTLANGFYVVSEDGALVASGERDVIRPMESVMIQIAPKDGAKVSYEKAKLTVTPSPLHKGSEIDNGSLAINVSNANYSDVAYVSFNEGLGLDKISHRNAEIPMVYVPVDGVNYAIAMMSQDVTEIPVSFQAATMGQYTIGVEAQDCEYAMMTLVDRFTGIETNLLIEDYTFIAKSNDSAERFIIKLAMDNSNGEANENFAFINNGMMYIYNIEGQGTVSVYDVTGRPVAEYNVATSANISTSDFAAGMYIIRMSDENGVKVQKIVVE